MIQDSASSAVLCALLAARERATGFAANESGCTGRLVAYTSAHAHSSVEKAVRFAGLGGGNLRFIEADEHFAMRPEARRHQIARDRQAGTALFRFRHRRHDFLERASTRCPRSAASAGSRPLAARGRAMSGAAALCPEFRHLIEGLEGRQLRFNPHKWMFTNFDCDCFYVGPGGADQDPEHPAGVPAERGDGVGRGDRLSRLAVRWAAGFAP